MSVGDKLQERTEAGKEITQEQIEEIKDYLIAKMNEAADIGKSCIEIWLLELKVKGYSKELRDAAIEWLNKEGIKAYVYTEEDRSTPMVGHKPKTYLYISCGSE
ncbi:hypothetical protein [Staphylococcus phage vB_SauS_IMEP5]|nr:hypothetical protein [Staphylococcus phage vB_SauS_IMEP5]